MAAYTINLYIWFLVGALIKIWLLNKKGSKKESENRFNYFSNA